MATGEAPNDGPAERSRWQARRLTRGDAILLVALCAGLVAFRVALLLSNLFEVYQQEYTILGRLVLDLDAGQVETSSLRAFVDSYQYGINAEGTLLVAFLASAFSWILGPTGWTLYAATITLELVTVALWGALLLKVLPRPWAVLALAPVLAPPWFAVWLQLTPSGNHSEFLWAPAALALFLVARDPDERPLWHWLLPAAVLALGILCYRLNLAAAPALLAAVLARWSRRTAVMGLAAFVLALVAVALVGGGGVGFDHLRDNVSFGRLQPFAALGWAWAYLPRPEAGPIQPARIALLLLPAGAVFAAIRRADLRPGAVFVLAWAAGALALPLLLDQPIRRYHLHLMYALLLCGGLGLAAARGWLLRSVVAAPLALLLFSGAWDVHDRIDVAAWQTTRQIDTLGLGQRLSVYHLEPDDVPYYRRMLDEDRSSPAASVMPYPIEPGSDVGHEYPAGPVHEIVSWQSGDWQRRGLDLRENWMWAGRGAWVAGKRDLPRLLEFWIAGGVVEPEIGWLWEGAVDEAERWGLAPPAGLAPPRRSPSPDDSGGGEVESPDGPEEAPASSVP